MNCRKPALPTRRLLRERGVALVLTLIMLAIITVVTVLFLATARRNRQVTTLSQDQTDAEFAAEAAYQRAVGEVLTNMLDNGLSNTVLRTNVLLPDRMAFDFLVSVPDRHASYATNWTVAPTNTRPFNQDLIPVVVAGRNTDPFSRVDTFLDLNRNRQFEDPTANENAPYGDPIWVGVLDKPLLPHGPNNRFVARIAYMVVPEGKAMDLNTIHNAASSTTGYDFKRNQGVGPWELNLAAFLAELNPDIWGPPVGYSYEPFPAPIAGGEAFIDARSIVEYRHDWGSGGAGARRSVANEYPLALGRFPPPSIDIYSDGRTSAGLVYGDDVFTLDDDTSLPLNRGPFGWAGAETPNHFFHHQELFDDYSYKVTNRFLGNLRATINGATNGSVATPANPMAFYRLVAQLGTDAGSDFDNRIHLNYADHNARIPGQSHAVTNFIPWDASPELAVTFFTNVAQRLFLAQSNEFNPSTNGLPLRGITAIPIFPTNLYSSSIHRLMQLAANIFDATRQTNTPSVFRPVFGPGEIPGVTYIVGWVNDNEFSSGFEAWLANNTNAIPLVIGAKKGFPSFNEFSVRTEVLVTRKLQVVREEARSGAPLIATNVMYTLGVSNSMFVEAWNSYAQRYPRSLTLEVSNYTVATLTNELGYQNTVVFATNSTMVLPTWRGFEHQNPSLTNSFVLALESTNQTILSNAVYRFSNNTWDYVGTNVFEDSRSLTPRYPMVYSAMNISNRVTYRMYETAQPRQILDFVVLVATNTVDVNRELLASANPYPPDEGAPNFVTELWLTNRATANDPTRGMLTQIDVSLGNRGANADQWRAYAPNQLQGDNDKDAAINAFRNFVGLSPLTGGTPFTTNTMLAMETPFNPAAKLVVMSSWQANDPLVHYHPTDLEVWPTNQNRQYLKPNVVASNIWPSSRLALNDRYSPWGGNPKKSPQSGEYPENSNRGLKDPGVYSSDYWQFPSNKLATVGWLGRVHRGSPWQTVYFKSERAPDNAWIEKNRDIRTHPANDWRLPDIFTTALDERTSRGLMSINQTNIESWSALLSGVVVLSNSMEAPVFREPATYTPLFIEPWAGRPIEQSPVALIWSNVYWLQTNVAAPYANPEGRAQPLRSIGDILSLPALTVESPFLNQEDPEVVKWGIDDAAYERIPQQILSLLRVGEPRFAVYAYGQALRPARINPRTGVVENYQVTAEFATRSVVRVEGRATGRLRAVVEKFNVLPPE